MLEPTHVTREGSDKGANSQDSQDGEMHFAMYFLESNEIYYEPDSGWMKAFCDDCGRWTVGVGVYIAI